MQLKNLPNNENAVAWFALDYADNAQQEGKAQNFAARFKDSHCLKRFVLKFAECIAELDPFLENSRENLSQPDSSLSVTDCSQNDSFGSFASKTDSSWQPSSVYQTDISFGLFTPIESSDSEDEREQSTIASYLVTRKSPLN